MGFVQGVAAGESASCVQSSSLGFDATKTGWQSLSLLDYFQNVQNGYDNNGIMLLAGDGNGIGFYSNKHTDAAFHPYLKVSFGETLPLSWKALAGNVGNTFLIGERTGQISVRKPIIDFENDIIGKSYTILVSVVDMHGLDDTGKVRIVIQDVNEPPYAQDDTTQVDENSDEGIQIFDLDGNDPDTVGLPSSHIRYSIYSVVADGIDYITGERKVTSVQYAASSFTINSD